MAQRPLVVVTGAAKRVGRAIAIDLANAGCDLLLHCHLSHGDAERTREACIAAGARAELLTADLEQSGEVERLAGEIASRAALGLAGLIHNASSYAASTFGSIRPEDALHHLRVNALAPLLLTQALAEPLRRARGAVVIMSDIHAHGRPRQHFAPYLMSKAAATSLVETLALELAPLVRVNGIAPGVIAWPEGADPEEVARYESRIPLARPGTPEEAAKLVRWLLFEASYLTGEVVRLDGGRALR